MNKIKIALISAVSLGCGVVIGYKSCQKLILTMVHDKEHMKGIIGPILEREIGKDKLERMGKIYCEKEPRVRSEDVIFQERGEAEAVLDSLCQLINDYGHATVADLDDLIGNIGIFKNNQRGWTELKDVQIKQIIHGYIIELPASQPIEEKGE